jgi:hypothetical protein
LHWKKKRYDTKKRYVSWKKKRYGSKKRYLRRGNCFCSIGSRRGRYKEEVRKLEEEEVQYEEEVRKKR